MPNPFDGMALPVDRPARCLLTHPITQAPLRLPAALSEEPEGPPTIGAQAFIEIVGFDSEAAQQHRFERQAWERRERREMTPAEADHDLSVQLAKMTKGWSLVNLDGSPVETPCTYDNAVALYSARATNWVRNQVLVFLANPENFAKAS